MIIGFEQVFKALSKQGVKYLVVGGVAVNMYGYTRFTGDIDILLALDPDNLARIDKVMKEMNFIERLPINIKELGDTKKLDSFVKEKELKAYTYISNDNPNVSLDVIVDESLEFGKFYKDRSEIKVWDIKLPVIAIDDLIEMKKIAGRDSDLVDVKALIELKDL